MAKNITPRANDYPQWYLDVIKAGELADYSPVRGCMIIRPNGYAIWELVQEAFDRRFKETGHVNAYFPLFIPMSFLAKEASHVEGFAMECAVVTHSGLEADGQGGLRPKNAIEEPLVVRPTSETIIGHAYSQWIQSWRDLPVLVNQWANIVRWEMRTRLFLRTMEFLWQEGHTAHETAEEAEVETRRMLDVYEEVAQDILALPVFKGEKTESERFAGAARTYCIEGLMQDGKALQAGTSHNLGQNFAKAFDITFQTRDQKVEHVWTTSWGVSTRLIGALIMTHSDDDGLVLPPRVAPITAAIVPIYKKDDEKEQVIAYAKEILTQLCGAEAVQRAESQLGNQEILAVPMDASEARPRKVALSADWLKTTLEGMQAACLERARAYREAGTRAVDSYDEFKEQIEGGGFLLMHWDGTAETEARVKAETKATIRCIPWDDALPTPAGSVSTREPGTDPVSGQPSKGRVIYARAY